MTSVVTVVRHSEPDITDLGRLLWKVFLLLCKKSKCEKISICKWISFLIVTFHIVEETPFSWNGLYYFYDHYWKVCFSILWQIIFWMLSKIQQTKMLVTCQRFGDWFLIGLVWQYSSIQKNIVKVGSKPWILTCSCHITLSQLFFTDPASKRELNFSNGYLSLLYFWSQVMLCSSWIYKSHIFKKKFAVWWMDFHPRI